MNKVLLSLLFGAFVFTGTTYAQTPPPAVVAAPAEAPVAEVHHSHHPEITKAKHKLREAKEALEKAAHDYGGHRVAAIKLIDQALEELKEAIESDK